MNFGNQTSQELEVGFIFKLAAYSESVGMIEARNAAGQHYSGTVFRLGERYVMTCWHVVQRILRK